MRGTGLLIGVFSGNALALLVPVLNVSKSFIISVEYIAMQISLRLICSFLGAVIPAIRANQYRISLLLKNNLNITPAAVCRADSRATGA
jgi:hypothetical protein